MKKSLFVLGSTGSIGTQTLDVAAHLGYGVFGLCAQKSVDRLEEQIRRFKPAVCVCTDETAAKELKNRVKDTQTDVLSGTDALLKTVREGAYDTLVNGIAGMAGTVPTVEAVRAKKEVVTANKEAIVTAWDVLRPLLTDGAPFLSCDSEHCAVFQCIGTERRAVDRITLTASGGPFFGKEESELRRVDVRAALAHPTWSMGNKITIDCATMMNKGLEIIEAAHLFDLTEDKIDVVIHRESILHSAVTFTDGSVLGQMSLPDMRLPIQYALTYPEREPSCVKPLRFAELGKLTFFEPEPWQTRALDLARRALREGGTAPTVFNTANEVAVSRFTRGELAFCDIVPFVENALNRFPVKYSPALEDIVEQDRIIRAEA